MQGCNSPMYFYTIVLTKKSVNEINPCVNEKLNTL
nr:MAG TPA: hypothetical protein [Ackermannviridae sp.]